MNYTRQDVMCYSAMLAGAGTIFAGILADMGATHTAWACIVVAGASATAGLLAYLHTPQKG